MKECSFCSEFTYKVPDNSLFENISSEEFKSRTIWQNEHFILTPTIGCFVEGYVLLITKRHISTFGALSKEELTSFEEIYPRICNMLEAEYGGCITFEHGSVELCYMGGGACEDHAHIHFIPKRIDFEVEIKTILNPIPLNSFVELAEYEKSGTPYLMYENANRERFICDAYNIQSQFLRMVSSAKIGIPNKWNWRIHPFVENMQSTLVSLSNSDNLKSLL